MKRNGTKQILDYGVIKNIKDLRDKVNRAKNKPTELVNLLCKDFNIRQNEQDRWLTYDILNNEETYEMEEIQDSYGIGRCRFIKYNGSNVQYVINSKARKEICITTIFYSTREITIQNKR